MLLAISTGLCFFGVDQEQAPQSISACAKTDDKAFRPVPLQDGGTLGHVTQLADGSLLSVYGITRPMQKWNDLSIPTRVFGRFSTDAGKHWTEPQLLCAVESPGHLHMMVPLGLHDGSIHIFGLLLEDVEWAKRTAYLWHAISRDGGKKWEVLPRTGFGHKYTGALNSVIQLKSGRILLPFSYRALDRPTGLYVCDAILSDDSGKTWRNSGSALALDNGGMHSHSGALEPVAAELADGRVWMLIRTQSGYFFESYSSDGGETWSSIQRTRFRSSNAPAGVRRLRDGRLVLVWNNELSEHPYGSSKQGIHYSRQSLVMAIHDGNVWKGFREIAPPFGPEDVRGAARYPFLAEAGDGSVLVGYRENGRINMKQDHEVTEDETGGTYWSGSRIFRVDPEWILKTDAFEDFSAGTRNLQLAGTFGARVTQGPSGKPELYLQKPKGDQPSGATWNFPFGKNGSLKVKMRLERGFGGLYLGLSEYFLPPSANQGGNFRLMIGSDLKIKIFRVNDASYLEEGSDIGELKAKMEEGRIHNLLLDWNCETNIAKVHIDGQYAGTLVGQEVARGMNYLRLVSAASDMNPKGLWISSFETHSVP